MSIVDEKKTGASHQQAAGSFLLLSSEDFWYNLEKGTIFMM
jgi:hypothetical protein